jgi:hypothetical protein
MCTVPIYSNIMHAAGLDSWNLLSAQFDHKYINRWVEQFEKMNSLDMYKVPKLSKSNYKVPLPVHQLVTFSDGNLYASPSTDKTKSFHKWEKTKHHQEWITQIYQFLSLEHSRLKAYLLYYSTLGKYLHNLQKRFSIRSSEQVFLE